MTAGCDRYWLGGPLFDEISINLPEGRKFTVVAENNSTENCVPQKVVLNGRELDRNFVTFEEIVSGGTLVFTMGPAEVH